ncbi:MULTISPECIES: glycosyltransferase family 2 protein [unclassified Vibrio]|uniref:glycosyltransferase family 2 protein n=1 Tax=unclassified Vibrio TaxID=2614977 RepID=UPI0020A5143E|nr:MULTISPECIES: glycosyltransferase family 2 protein [unclassified Vibrio]
MNIAVLMTCFNRVEKTLNCLNSLEQQKYIESIELDVYLVDDGSSDGTSEAVCNKFPNVKLISGNGNLYWNGGMRLAWKKAIDSGINYDGFLWLNDDVTLLDDAVSRIVTSLTNLRLSGIKVGAICGQMVNDKGTPTYGGWLDRGKDRLKPKMLQVDDKFNQLSDTINGNFVLVSREGYEEIGNLCEVYTHQMGDFDYGYRLTEKGFLNFQLKGVAGYCSSNSKIGTFRDISLDFKTRLKLLNRPNQIAPVDEWKYFVKKHSRKNVNVRMAKLYFRKYAPSIWLILFGR